MIETKETFPVARSRKARLTLSEALRDLLDRRGESLRSIQRATGIDPVSLRAFREGRSLRLDRADRLATYFEIEIRKPRRIRTPPPRKPGRPRKNQQPEA